MRILPEQFLKFLAIGKGYENAIGQRRISLGVAGVKSRHRIFTKKYASPKNRIKAIKAHESRRRTNESKI